jgi:hypothetical protein
MGHVGKSHRITMQITTIFEVWATSLCLTCQQMMAPPRATWGNKAMSFEAEKIKLLRGNMVGFYLASPPKMV